MASNIRGCCVDKCKSTSATHRLYTLPRNSELRALWCRILQPHVTGLNDTTTRGKKVCELHFQPDVAGSTKRPYTACPTLFSEQEIESGQPTVPVRITFIGTAPDDDHTYNMCIPPRVGHDPSADDEKIKTVINISHDHDYEHSYHKKTYTLDIGPVVLSTSGVTRHASSPRGRTADACLNIVPAVVPSKSGVTTHPSSPRARPATSGVTRHASSPRALASDAAGLVPSKSGVTTHPSSPRARPATSGVTRHASSPRALAFDAAGLVPSTCGVTTHPSSPRARPATSGVTRHASSPRALAFDAAGLDTAPAAVPSTSGVTRNASSPPAQTARPVYGFNCRYPGQRFRLVQSVQNLSPPCKRLYKKCVHVIRSQRRELDTFKQRLAKADELLKNKQFEELIQNLTPRAKIFLQMQVTQANAHIKRRRFTLDEKLLALQLQKQSPKGYKLLRLIFILPSRRTLNKVTQDVVLKPGINKRLFAQLKDITRTWDDKRKLCSILFDEVALIPGIKFIEFEDRIEGFVDYGNDTKDISYADHALVFMLRGLITSWTQVVAYYLIEKATPALTLKNILKDVVEAVVDTGLTPKVIICDQGPTFQSCVNNMRNETRRDRILHEERLDNKLNIGNQRLNIVFDPPHLIKCVRNNFLTKDMIFCGKICKWSDIVEVYKADCQVGDIRMLHKLTDEHVMADKMHQKKMKVKNCVQVLSESMSAVLKYTATYAGTRRDGTPVSTTMLNTAEAVLFFDRLFDSANGSRGGSAPGKMRGPVKEVDGKSKHVEFWTDAIKKIETIKFMDNSSKRAVTAGRTLLTVAPCLSNWIVTLKSLIEIWDQLKALGVKYFYTRQLNQDPIENFFGRIRAYNFRDNDPDPSTFVNTLKSLLISGFLGDYSSHFNCEDDRGQTLFAPLSHPLFQKDGDTAETLLIADEPEAELQSSGSAPAADCVGTASGSSCDGLDGRAQGLQDELFQQARQEKTSVHSTAYVAGYVSRKLVQKFKCRACANTFLTSEILSIHAYISCRERSTLRGRNLKYPTQSLLMAVRNLCRVIKYKLDTSPRSNVVRDIKSRFLMESDTSFLGCPQHHDHCVDFFVALVCRVQVHNHCNTICRIVKGAFPSKVETQKLTKLQRLAVEKYKSRSRKNK